LLPDSISAKIVGEQIEEKHAIMAVEQIEQIKRDYTDKYVVVDATRPELARFRDVVGRVKTVNMNGRALVEFDGYHLNVGWYDIAPEFLKVVDKPAPKAPKPEVKKAAPKAAPAKKPAGEAASSGLSPSKAAAGAPPKAGKPSVAEILAAARAGKAAAPTTAQPPAEKAPAAEAPAKPKVDRSKMSVADMIAAARTGGAAGAAPPAKPQAEPAPPQEPEAEEVAAAPTPAPKVTASIPPKATEKIDKSKMSIDEILAWCRQHDAK
jgi:hypothetical protein